MWCKWNFTINFTFMDEQCKVFILTTRLSEPPTEINPSVFINVGVMMQFCDWQKQCGIGQSCSSAVDVTCKLLLVIANVVCSLDVIVFKMLLIRSDLYQQILISTMKLLSFSLQCNKYVDVIEQRECFSYPMKVWMPQQTTLASVHAQVHLP